MDEIGKVESSLLSLVNDSAFEDKRKSKTNQSFPEEVNLMKTACERIDILNLRLGIYTNTVIAKIALCKEILEINGDQLPEHKIKLLNKYLVRMEKIIAKKLRYGKRLSKYLEKKDEDLIETIKSNLLETDLHKYEKIQKRLVSFRDELVLVSNKILKHFPKKITE